MDPLAQLKDIHTPQGVDWWPLAWGWWVLVIMVIALLGALAYVTLRHIRFNRARREAIAMHKAMSPDAQYPARVNQLLKRVTLHYFDADLTAAAYGDTWLGLLKGCVAPKHQEQVATGLTLLVQSSYQASSLNDQQLSEINNAVGKWLRHAKLKHPPLTNNHQEVSAHV